MKKTLLLILLAFAFLASACSDVITSDHESYQTIQTEINPNGIWVFSVGSYSSFIGDSISVIDITSPSSSIRNYAVSMADSNNPNASLYLLMLETSQSSDVYHIQGLHFVDGSYAMLVEPNVNNATFTIDSGGNFSGESTGIIKLTDANFEEELSSNEYELIFEGENESLNEEPVTLPEGICPEYTFIGVRPDGTLFQETGHGVRTFAASSQILVNFEETYDEYGTQAYRRPLMVFPRDVFANPPYATGFRDTSNIAMMFGSDDLDLWQTPGGHPSTSFEILYSSDEYIQGRFITEAASYGMGVFHNYAAIEFIMPGDHNYSEGFAKRCDYDNCLRGCEEKEEECTDNCKVITPPGPDRRRCYDMCDADSRACVDMCEDKYK